jgi:hypothetical protein
LSERGYDKILEISARNAALYKDPGEAARSRPLMRMLSVFNASDFNSRGEYIPPGQIQDSITMEKMSGNCVGASVSMISLAYHMLDTSVFESLDLQLITGITDINTASAHIWVQAHIGNGKYIRFDPVLSGNAGCFKASSDQSPCSYGVTRGTITFFVNGREVGEKIIDEASDVLIDIMGAPYATTLASLDDEIIYPTSSVI